MNYAFMLRSLCPLFCTLPENLYLKSPFEVNKPFIFLWFLVITTNGGYMQASQVTLEGSLLTPGKCYKPLDLGRILVFDKNRSFCGIALECKFGKGAVSRLSEIADSMDAAIRFIQVSMEEADEPFVNAIAFLDISDSRITPEEALELVKKQEFIREARLIRPSTEGFICDDYFFPLTVGNERSIIFRKTVYEALFKGLREKFGSAGEAMLYYQGFNVGYGLCASHMSMGCAEKPEFLIEMAKAFSRTLGWAIIDHYKIDLKKGKAKLRVYQNFECEVGKGSEKPYSHFYRGVIAGWFHKFFGKSVEVKETKCIAKGDAYCEFLIQTH